MARHTHFIVQGYVREAPTGELQDVATIDVYADTSEEAFERAQQLVRKKHYRVQQVVEHDPDLETPREAHDDRTRSSSP